MQAAVLRAVRCGGVQREKGRGLLFVRATAVTHFRSFAFTSSSNPSSITAVSPASTTTTTTSTTQTTDTATHPSVPPSPAPPWADPASRQYKFWNREANAHDKHKFSNLLQFSPESRVKEARIISLAAPDDDASHHHLGLCNSNSNSNSNIRLLPDGARLLAVGTELSDFGSLRRNSIAPSAPQQQHSPSSQSLPNVLFVSPSCPRASVVVPLILAAFPSLEWIHVRSAGIDFIASDEFASLCTRQSIAVTNAKGQFSSSLAEYALLACSYFAKNVPRLLQQQSNKQWLPYDIEELRGKTLGVVGYGDIGKAVVKLATVYGMRVVALRRHPYLSRHDPYCAKVYGRDKSSLHQLLAESDYIVCSAPSTVETRGIIDATALTHVKRGSVLVNLGRGPVIDQDALTQALQPSSGLLKGAALDVFVEEPLPQSSPLWTMQNVLISPHNMDQTATFMHEATEFFVYENLPRFLCGEDLLNPVDPTLGY